MSIIDRKTLENFVEEYGVYCTIRTMADICLEKAATSDSETSKRFNYLAEWLLLDAANKMVDFSNRNHTIIELDK
jgi:hypothetical protein